MAQSAIFLPSPQERLVPGAENCLGESLDNRHQEPTHPKKKKVSGLSQCSPSGKVLPYLLSPTGVTCSSLGRCCSCNAFASQLKNSGLKKLRSFIIKNGQENLSKVTSERDIIFIILDSKRTCPLLQREIPSLCSIRYQTSLKRSSRTKDYLSTFAHKMFRNTRNT